MKKKINFPKTHKWPIYTLLKVDSQVEFVKILPKKNQNFSNFKFFTVKKKMNKGLKNSARASLSRRWGLFQYQNRTDWI